MDAITAEPLTNPSAYAKSRDVRKQTIHRAIAVGTIPVYDANGNPVAPDTPGAKFVRPTEADQAREASWSRSPRVPTVDPTAASGSGVNASQASPPTSGVNGHRAKAAGRNLTNARYRVESLRETKLEMELDRERGDSTPRDAVLDALARAVGGLAEELSTIANLADELDATSRTGGVDAVRAMLRQRVNDLRGEISRRVSFTCSLRERCFRHTLRTINMARCSHPFAAC